MRPSVLHPLCQEEPQAQLRLVVNPSEAESAQEAAELSAVESADIALSWLLSLRWWMIASHSAAIALAVLVFDLSVPLVQLITVLAVLFLSNVWLYSVARRQGDISYSLLGGVLLFDTLLLSLLLYWSGGATNPFSVLFLIYIALASVLLSQVWTWSLVFLAAAAFFALLFYYTPVVGLGPPMSSQHDGLCLHLQGMWLAFVLAAVITAYFLSRISKLIQEKSLELQTLQARKLNEQRLASLTTLSAGAAHELGTPLSTIAVVSKELRRAAGKLAGGKQAIIRDVELIRREVDRCRGILEKMGLEAGQLKMELPVEIELQDFRATLEEKYHFLPPERFVVEISAGESRIKAPEEGLRQSLSALIKNALDASPEDTQVRLEIEVGVASVHFCIQDRGTGMTEEVLKRAEEPFFSTKEPGKGMGLGLFLAKLFVERWGGEMSISANTGGGTAVCLTLPKSPGCS